MKQNSIFFLLILGLVLLQTNCCPSSCQQCNGNSSNCDICKPGFYLIDKNCYQCTKPCSTCSTSVTACSACVDSANQVIPTCACNSGFK